MVITKTTSTDTLHSISSYLEAEDVAEERHEFNDGIVVVMPSLPITHTAIKGRFLAKTNMLFREKRLPHIILTSEIKVRIESHNRFVYPDILVLDGKPKYYQTPYGELREDTITNPLLIVEVLSDSTREHDKGEKFEHYASISTFREYILVEPEQCWIKSYFLQEPESDLWKITTLTDIDAMLPLRSLGLELSVQEVYAVLEKL